MVDQLSEQDFYLLNGNSYRGSRYANFVGSGVDPQGNVSSAINENAANIGKGTSVDPQQTQTTPAVQGAEQASRGLIGNVQTDQPQTLGGTVKNMAISGAVPFATSSIGQGIGAATASGLTTSEGLRLGVGAIKDKISSGLLGGTSGLGAGSTATNAALASMGNKFGPATSSSVGKASAGAGVGGAVGTGVGSFASTLLTGGSLKQAAASGIGSAAGFYIGNMILPGVGGFIGSTLGSMVSGLFGGSKPPRTTLGVSVGPDDTGRMKTNFVNSKGNQNEAASKYADQINNILNTFADATGIKYTSGLTSETNIGNRDVKTVWGSKDVISSNPADAGAIALNLLKRPNYYTMGSDTNYNDFFQRQVKEASSINDLASRLDSYTASRNLTATLPKTGRDKRTSFYG